jgi:tyrosine-protein kinase Etk/Wzc
MATRKPQELATAMIGVENTADVTAVKDVSGLMQAQSDLIQSRAFLQNIVQKLSLRFALKHYVRSSIFESVSVDSSAAEGTYRFLVNTKNGEDYSVLFDNDSGGLLSPSHYLSRHAASVVSTGSLKSLSSLRGGGLSLDFSQRFVNAPHDFIFRIRAPENALEDLFGAVSVKESDSRNGVSNIAVSVKGRDYKLIADIANTIAEMFVQKNVNFKKARTRDLVASLEKQLDAVSRDQEASTEALRSFQSANPGVGLTEDVKQRINNLGQMEKGAFESKRALSDGHELLGKYASAAPTDRQDVAQQIVAFLMSRNQTSAATYQTELSELSSQAREFKRSYAEDHPLRVENQQKLDKVTGEIAATLQNYVSSTQKGVEGQSADIQSRYSELQSLPSKELQLAELQRRHQIFSDIYSTVMSRYNQAKVLDASQEAEVFVMDPALPPVPPPPAVPKILAMAMLAALMITLLPVIVADYFDKTAHSEDDFTVKTGGIVLEGIPRIDLLRKKALHGGVNGWHGINGASLITIQNEEGMSKEVFRALRTKLMLALVDTKEKSLVVTSLEPGAGKSTITANVAYAVAQQQTKTVVIDADLRRGTLYKWFSKSQGPGLSDYLASSEPFSAARVDALLQPTTLPNLFFISAGTPVQASSELLASDRFVRLKNELASRFSFIAVDSSPIEAVVDAAVFAHLFSAFLVVARAGQTDVVELTRKLAEFPVIEEKVLGFVVNDVFSERTAKYYHYSSYYSAAKPDKR